MKSREGDDRQSKATETPFLAASGAEAQGILRLRMTVFWTIMLRFG
jgi:hypothetical protein